MTDNEPTSLAHLERVVLATYVEISIGLGEIAVLSALLDADPGQAAGLLSWTAGKAGGKAAEIVYDAVTDAVAATAADLAPGVSYPDRDEDDLPIWPNGLDVDALLGRTSDEVTAEVTELERLLRDQHVHTISATLAIWDALRTVCRDHGRDVRELAPDAKFLERVGWLAGRRDDAVFEYWVALLRRRLG